MSRAEVYITGAIHWSGTGMVPTSIRAQITQYTSLKVSVPRKGMRTADLKTNLLNPELGPVYGTDQFSTYSNFLYVKWRGHVVFWGPILIKEVDFEESSVTIHAKDRGASLEKLFWELGDTALDGKGGTGNLPVSWDGVRLAWKAGNDHLFPGYIPVGVQMGANNHTDYGRKIGIERSQQIWRTLMDLGDRTDGPLMDLVPQDVSSSVFAVCDVYGQYRTDRSATVKLEYETGYNNVRNITTATGGEVLSNCTVVTANKHWRTTSYYKPTGQAYGLWMQWEQVDWDLDDGDSLTDVDNSLGAVGDAVLDAYGRPLISAEVVLRRDDQMQDLNNQFYWLDDFLVGDIIQVSGQKGPESFTGKYLIDAVRLEQEGDNTGEIRQALDLIPHVPTGLYPYEHDTDRIHTYDKNP